MLVSIPPNMTVSGFMGYLKGKSTMMIFERYAKLKYKHWNRHFWSRGYYVSTVGHNKQAVQKYIKNQGKEDMISNQIGLVEYYDPFQSGLKDTEKNQKTTKKIKDKKR
jgi:putative transposase